MKIFFREIAHESCKKNIQILKGKMPTKKSQVLDQSPEGRMVRQREKSDKSEAEGLTKKAVAVPAAAAGGGTIEFGGLKMEVVPVVHVNQRTTYNVLLY